MNFVLKTNWSLVLETPDGTDIHTIGFNLGRDAEPVVANDGKILFFRLELFSSRMKTEWNLLSVMPDGTMPITHHGPERRSIWRTIRGASALSPPPTPSAPHNPATVLAAVQIMDVHTGQRSLLYNDPGTGAFVGSEPFGGLVSRSSLTFRPPT